MTDPYPTRGKVTGLHKRLDPVLHTAPARRTADQESDRLQRFARDGFLFVPDLFFAAESESLLREAETLREAALRKRPAEAFFESNQNAVRSIFGVHRTSEIFAGVCRDPRVLKTAQSILGDDIYVHQSRLNYKPAFCGREFYWHSDFETWHAEDGMPRMRALSLSLSLTPTLATNGPLMLIPGSHETFVSCAGETPPDHYRQSLIQQRVGTPDAGTLERMAKRRGIRAPVGGAGSAVFFDCNTMHGSCSNITPFPRTNLFVVFNATSNRLQQPYSGLDPRPEFVAARENIELLPTEKHS